MKRQISQSIFMMATIQSLDLTPLRESKTAAKCRLKDCQRMTTHNGGYCSAEHCKLDREKKKGPK